MPDDGVDIWKSELTVAPCVMSSDILTPEEVWRAEQYRFHRDRSRFVAGRIFLRTVISLYLRCRPAEVKFKCNVYGKPELADLRSAEGLAFNVSHAHELALCAVTRNRSVGIDVEFVGMGIEWESIAQSVFSDTERAYLCAVSAADRRAAFFRQWTLKEAYSKGLGRGLSLPWRDFEIYPRAYRPAPVLAEGQCWTVSSFEPEPAYVAALAVEGLFSYIRLGLLRPKIPSSGAAAVLCRIEPETFDRCFFPYDVMLT